MTRKLRSMAAASMVVVSAVSLGSCSRVFEIEFSGFGPNIRLEFHDDGLFQSVRQATCLKELTVYELVGPSGREQLAWQIKAPTGCVTLTGIDIGHVPDGFAEATKRLPLKVGSRYQASARAEKDYPERGISARWFVCRRSPEETDWKNEYELRELPPSCLRQFPLSTHCGHFPFAYAVRLDQGVRHVLAARNLGAVSRPLGVSDTQST